MKAVAPAIVDLARYPIDELDSPAGQAFPDDRRTGLRRDGALLLPGFVKSASLPRPIAEAEAGAGKENRISTALPDPRPTARR